MESGLRKYEAYKLLCDIYHKSRWPFFNKVDLYKFGISDKVLWQLHQENKIRARDGIHGRIVELIEWNEN